MGCSRIAGKSTRRRVDISHCGLLFSSYNMLGVVHARRLLYGKQPKCKRVGLPGDTYCGRVKTAYRKRNYIPGLKSDDNCGSCCCWGCSIAQVRNELDLAADEKKRQTKVINALHDGMKMERGM